MAKDPAALVYIDKWIASTNGMPASYRAWYFDLLLYQYDRGEIPDDLDELAGICRVRPSEYDLFKQMVKQVLEQKFKQTESGGYANEVASEIISKRQSFKKKRAVSGTIGVIVKKAGKIKGFNKKYIGFLKKDLFEKNLDELEEYKKEQVLKQMLKLYIDEDVDENVNENKHKNKGEKVKSEKSKIELPYETESFRKVWDGWKEYKLKEHRFRYKTEKSESAALSKLSNLSNCESEAIEIIQESIANGWKGFFEVKDKNRNDLGIIISKKEDIELFNQLKITVNNFVSAAGLEVNWYKEEEQALYDLTKKITQTCRSRGEPATLSHVNDMLQMMLNRLSNFWKNKGFSIKKLDNNYNSIINEIRKSRNNSDSFWDNIDAHLNSEEAFYS